MCRYCKKLREINDLREKNLNDCIKKWKRRDFLARQLVSLLYFNLTNNTAKYFEQEVADFLIDDWIGK